ncbi:cysteine desulfurase [bacterium]|nr:cysteine desulfurase [bacterium]
MLNPDKLRQDFPMFQQPAQYGKPEFIYFDNAATTQKPRSVIDALVTYYEKQNTNVHRAIYRLGEQTSELYEEGRRSIGRFINARSSREIVFTRGATEAINLVAASWGRSQLQPGDEIIVTEMEHHANLIPWQQISHEKGVILKSLSLQENGTLDFSELETLFTDRTRLIALTHVSNVFGTVNPVRGVTEFAHQRGALVLVDAAQSVPHMPVDVQRIGCDFLAFSGHKMLGPTGIGVLYGRESLLEKMPPYQTGGDMIRSVWMDRATWNELPHKFEAGTPNIAGVIGLAAAVAYFNKINMEEVTLLEQELTTYAMLKMMKLKGMRIFGNAPERAGVISFQINGIHAHDMAQFLDHQNIAVRAGNHCAQPAMRKLGVPSTTRASLYFYNTYAEIDRFIESLKKAKEFFGYGV